MLLGCIARDHSNNDLFTLGEEYILVRKVVARLSKCFSDYVNETLTEHETKESFGCLIEVSSVHPSLVEIGIGGTKL